MKNYLQVKSSNRANVSSMFTEVQGWFCYPVNLLLAWKKQVLTSVKPLKKVKNMKKKKSPHGSSSAQDRKWGGIHGNLLHVLLRPRLSSFGLHQILFSPLVCSKKLTCIFCIAYLVIFTEADNSVDTAHMEL